jgi:hypothetical protein
VNNRIETLDIRLRDIAYVLPDMWHLGKFSAKRALFKQVAIESSDIIATLDQHGDQ